MQNRHVLIRANTNMGLKEIGKSRKKSQFLEENDYVLDRQYLRGHGHLIEKAQEARR